MGATFCLRAESTSRQMKTLSTLTAVYRDALKRLVTVKCYDTCAMYTAFCVALPPTLKQWENPIMSYNTHTQYVSDPLTSLLLYWSTGGIPCCREVALVGSEREARQGEDKHSRPPCQTTKMDLGGDTRRSGSSVARGARIKRTPAGGRG